MDEAAAESGSAPPETPAVSPSDSADSPDMAASPDVAANPDVAAATEGSVGSAGELPAPSSLSDEPHRDHASAMLAAGLGLLGIGGAAGLAGASSASPAAGSKPIGVIDPPNTDHPKSDPLVPEQKPDPGSSKPGADQPSADHPPPDLSHTGQPQQPDPGPTNAGPSNPGPSNPDPAQPTGTDHQPPAQPGGTDQPPPVHVPVAPTLALATDTGVSAQDHITSSGSVNVSGLEAEATLAISLDGGKTWTPHGGDAQLPDTLFGADGEKHLEIRQVDAHGHEGAVAELSFTLDRTAPDAPHWTMPDGKSALNASDFIEPQGVEAGASVEYRLDPTAAWVVATDGRTPVSTFHQDGTVHLEVRQTDLAGNTSPLQVVDATVDVTPPLPPAISLPSDDGLPSMWTATRTRSGDITVVIGQSDWQYQWDGGAWQTSSRGVIPQSQLPGEGLHTLSIFQRDAAGNETFTQRQFTIDDTAPVGPRPELINDNGAGASDRISGDMNLRVVGLEPGASWMFSNGLSHIAYVGSGDTIPMSALGLDPSGGRQVSRVGVQQQDEAGNRSPMVYVDFTYDPSLGTGVFHV